MKRHVLLVIALASSTFVAAGTYLGTAAAAAPPPVVASTQTITAPDAGATGFADGFSLDTTHAVAAATLGTARVVYVFDRNANGTWSHSATIHAPAGATHSWGAYLAVSGNTIAVSDPDFMANTGNSGNVEIFNLVSGTWQLVQTLRLTIDFAQYAQGIWLSGNGLVVRDDVFCDASCDYGRWFVYQRNAANQFVQTSVTNPAYKMNVGPYGTRFVIGNTGFEDDFNCTPHNSELVVRDVSTNPSSVALDQTVTYAPPDCNPVIDDWFRNVDIAGTSLVYEACCTNRQELHVLRDNGSGYLPEAVLPITKLSDALLEVPGVILRADASAGVLHTTVFHGATWTADNDLALPADAAFPNSTLPLRDAPIAAANMIAIKGSESLHILTIVSDPSQPTNVNATARGTTVATGSLSVSFVPSASDGGSAITSYTATCTSSNGGVTRTASKAAGPITVAGLTTGKTYQCTVKAVNGFGTGDNSVASPPVIVGAPGAPANVHALSGSTIGATGPLVVSWTAAVTNGSAITSYTATCTSSNGGVTRTASKATSPVTVTAVTTAKTYTCKVTATNARSAGPASAPSLPVNAGSPAAPTNITAVKIAAGQIRVSFTPGGTNGATVTGYTATCTSTNGGVTASKTGTATRSPSPRSRPARATRAPYGRTAAIADPASLRLRRPGSRLDEAVRSHVLPQPVPGVHSLVIQCPWEALTDQ